MRTGRPTIRTPEICDDIIDRITAGEPLAQILRTEGYPSPSTFYRWCDEDKTLSGDLARARLYGYDAIAVDTLSIADTPELGVIEKHEVVLKPDPANPDGEPIREMVVTERRHEDMLGHRKLKVDTRLKLLACWDPKRYGSRVEVEHSGKLELSTAVMAARQRLGGRVEPPGLLAQDDEPGVIEHESGDEGLNEFERAIDEES